MTQRAQVARIAWRRAATRRNASQSEVLPTPLSPVTKTTCRLPSTAASKAPMSCCIGVSRPTKIGSSAVGGDRSRGRFDDRSDEDVAALDDAADEVRAGGVVAEGAANLADEHLDVVGMNVGVGPDGAEQGIAANDVPGPVDEDPQDLEGFMSERNPGMSAPERPPLGVNPERSEIFHVGGLSPVAGECGALTDGAAPILPKYYRYDAGATRGLTRLLLQSNFQAREISQRIIATGRRLSPRWSSAGPRSLSSLPA